MFSPCFGGGNGGGGGGGGGRWGEGVDSFRCFLVEQ